MKVNTFNELFYLRVRLEKKKVGTNTLRFSLIKIKSVNGEISIVRNCVQKLFLTFNCEDVYLGILNVKD